MVILLNIGAILQFLVNEYNEYLLHKKKEKICHEWKTKNVAGAGPARLIGPYERGAKLVAVRLVEFGRLGVRLRASIARPLWTPA